MRLTPDQVLHVIERYVTQRESPLSIATSFGMHPTSVQGLLKRRGLLRDRSNGHRRYTCDHTFFDAIVSEEQAYWLGFLMADGYVNAQPQVGLQLARIDREHLVRFQSALQSNHPLSDYDYSYQTPTSRLLISSPGLAAGLEEWGVVPNKTKTVRWPDALSAELQRHVLRGYFDGDGSFYVSKDRTITEFYLTSNEQFLEGARDFLCRSLGLRMNKLKRKCNSTVALDLRYKGNRQVARIADFMYTDSTIHLPRKRNKVVHLLTPAG